MVDLQTQMARERSEAIRGVETAMKGVYPQVDPPLIFDLCERTTIYLLDTNTLIDGLKDLTEQTVLQNIKNILRWKKIPTSQNTDRSDGEISYITSVRCLIIDYQNYHNTMQSQCKLMSGI